MQRYLNTTHHNIAWFKQMAETGQLDMHPPFQRNPVWSERQKSFLIDSILHEYPVPELYMQEKVDDKGHQKHIIVDGQQRIRACLEYIEGNFSINGDDSPDLPEATFDELSPESKRKIYEYNFVVRVLPDMDDGELRQIFKRLNRNVVVLNAQELRHATYWGKFIQLMEQLSDDESWGIVRIFSARDTRRMLDVEYISELTIGLLHGPQDKTRSLENYYIAYEKSFEAEHRVKSSFTKILGEILQILPDIADTRWRKKSDFYTLFLVLSNHLSDLPLASEKRNLARKLLIGFSQQVQEFLNLRDVRETHKFPQHVADFASTVERSVSDIGNRKRRAENLEIALAPLWESAKT
jgi:hypothetical protein